MYRLLKQFKSTGFFVIAVDEFRETLDIPASYRMSEIDKKVFTPIKKELSPLYERFEIEKVKKKGNKIIQIKFHFKYLLINNSFFIVFISNQFLNCIFNN